MAKIQNMKYRGKKLVGPAELEFDENGVCECDDKIAEALVKLDGFELAADIPEPPAAEDNLTDEEAPEETTEETTPPAKEEETPKVEKPASAATRKPRQKKNK